MFKENIFKETKIDNLLSVLVSLIVLGTMFFAVGRLFY